MYQSPLDWFKGTKIQEHLIYLMVKTMVSASDFPPKMDPSNPMMIFPAKIGWRTLKFTDTRRIFESKCIHWIIIMFLILVIPLLKDTIL